MFFFIAAASVFAAACSSAGNSSSTAGDGGKTSIPPTATIWTTPNGGNGHGYLLVRVAGGITWTDANTAGTTAGGHLATISDAAENAFVWALSAPVATAWLEGTSGVAVGPWLGASAQGPTWTWVTGEQWSYTAWAVGQPSGTSLTGAIESKLDLLGTAGGAGSVQVAGWNDSTDFAAPSYVIEFE